MRMQCTGSVGPTGTDGDCKAQLDRDCVQQSAARCAACLLGCEQRHVRCVRPKPLPITHGCSIRSIVPKAHCGDLCVVHRPLYPVTFDETNFAFVRLNKVALGKATLELVFCDQSLNRLPGELVSFFLSIIIPAGLTWKGFVTVRTAFYLQNSKPVDIQVQQENEAEFLLQ
jgi:hypothetical protein